MAAPINLRSLESRFPVRGCGQTVDLSANKRTKKSTEKEEKKRKEKRRGKRRKKKNAEREEPASQFTLLVRFTSNLRNSKQLLLAETERNSKKKKWTKRDENEIRYKGMTGRVYRISEKNHRFHRFAFQFQILKGISRRGLDINDSSRS